MKISYAAAYHSLTHGDGRLFRQYCEQNHLDMHGSPIEELYARSDSDVPQELNHLLESPGICWGDEERGEEGASLRSAQHTARDR